MVPGFLNKLLVYGIGLVPHGVLLPQVGHLPLWTSLLAVIGVYICWALARVLMVSALLTRVMTYIGQSTLILLIFHGEIQHKTFDLMERLGLHPFMAACVGLVVALLVPLLIGEVIKREAFLRFFYFPFPVRKAPKP